MIKAFSQKLNPPFSGQVQVVESDTYRALALDSKTWEIQYVRRSHIKVGTLSAAEVKSRNYNKAVLDKDAADPALMEILDFMADVSTPLPSIDHYEYWLLDSKDESPLALVYTCAEAEQMAKFPTRATWTALPDSVMAIEKNESEISAGLPPVNYRLESAVNERAGANAKAAWFDRRHHVEGFFPGFLIREDWEDSTLEDLAHRYINRQSPRLLMLPELSHDQRDRLEKSAEPYATEVARFCGLYSEIINKDLIRALCVQARLINATSAGNSADMNNNRLRI